MKPKRRKWIAILALITASVMLFLERGHVSRGSGESWFWVTVAILAGVLAILELIGFGVSRHPEDQQSQK